MYSFTESAAYVGLAGTLNPIENDACGGAHLTV
jgi:hypothetical protein